MKSKVYVTLLLLILPISSLASDRAFEKYALVYHEKLMLGKFEEIENDAKEARAKSTTISDGQPLLAAIYGGVSGCSSLSCNFPKILSEWESKEKILEEWVKKYPDSVTAQVGYAGYYIQLGWFHRGRGYSKTVSNESWVLFKDNLEKARILLINHSEKIKKDAGWSFAMLSVALYQSWTEQRFNQVYDDAISSHSIYIPLYFLKSAYMEPKWHGSLIKFNSYVDSVVQDTKPVLGNQMYTRLHWSGSGSNLFRSGRTNWKKMKQGFEELMAKYPDSWNINNYAKFSCLAGDTIKLAELLKKIGGYPLTAAWFNNRDFYLNCVEFSRRD